MSTNAAYLEQADEKKVFENLREFIRDLYENRRGVKDVLYLIDVLENCDKLEDVLYLIDVLEESVVLTREGLLKDLLVEVIGEVKRVFYS